ncbi:hypothetical protein ACA910_007137 [Epithemia clementina (nom. ined.)]
MTLTTVIGSSGSGKTTFLNDVHHHNKCSIYIRQYHSIRPYIPVSKIPNFDPTKLPFWEVYVGEHTAETIKVGGTMAGEFTAGLSGGQRKLLLFELICQRTTDHADLLIALDEPFAGVTDDFVPFIVDRLYRLRQRHNVVLVTNDHVDTLTKMSDNTITISVMDRGVVKVNDTEDVDRQLAIFALSQVGDRSFKLKATDQDFLFFWEVEIGSNQALVTICLFTVVCFLVFIVTFWDSDINSTSAVMVAGAIVAYFCVNPYLISLVDWRNTIDEEAKALMHSSIGINHGLKALLTSLIILLISFVEYGVVNVVLENASSFTFWAGMFADSVSSTVPLICLGIYTKMDFQSVNVVGSFSFLCLIFLSTTFSPGAGVTGVKELRYLFPRYYFWCLIPDVQDRMDGCPESETWTVVFMMLSSLAGLFLFIVLGLVHKIQQTSLEREQVHRREKIGKEEEFAHLQQALYGEKAPPPKPLVVSFTT